MKTFYIKLLTIIAIFVGLYLSLNYYYTYIQYKNFQIVNERQAMIIQLPNTEYIEIASRNDNVTNYEDFQEKPFNVNTKIQKNSNLENSIVKTDVYVEYVENTDKNRREIVVTPIDNKTLNIELDIQTTYMYEGGLRYNIQLDYSNKVEYKKEDDYIYFEDKGCRVEIHDDLLDYDITQNKQTLILSRTYGLEVEYDIQMVINCKK